MEKKVVLTSLRMKRAGQWNERAGVRRINSRKDAEKGSVLQQRQEQVIHFLAA